MGHTGQIVGAVVIAVVCLILAYQKGYSPWCWLLACSFIGLLVLITLPDACDPYTKREERHRLRKRGNWMGIGLSLLFVGIMAIAIVHNLKDAAAKKSRNALFPSSNLVFRA